MWTSYAKSDASAFPVRRKRVRDFGKSKFSKHPDDVDLVGRRVDLFGRTIDVKQDAISSVWRYFGSRSRTATKLSQKAAVLLYPSHLRGEVAWPKSAPTKAEE